MQRGNLKLKKLRILGRSIRDSFKSVFRNFSLSFASISCITITLIVVAISVIMSLNVNNFTKIVEDDVTIVAFLRVDITDEEIENIRSQIVGLDNITCQEANCPNVLYVDKMTITEDMMNSSETLSTILKDYTKEDSPIQSTFQIRVDDIDYISDTANNIKNIDGVDSVKYGEGMVEQLVSVFEFIRKTCIIIVLALVVVTAVLISNTIKITIFSRRKEIEIMRLVGASNTHIKIPFVFEGLILGMLGAIVPIILTIYGYTALYDHFHGQLFSQFIKLVSPIPFIYFISLGLLLVGMIVGMIGSSRAVRKYLKV
jgi:cell division transport system permease protein